MTLKPPQVAALADVLFIRAADTPDRLAFDVRGERLTWSDLLEGALRAASAFRRVGVAPGVPCALTLSTRPEWLWSFFGASLLGAVPVAINPRLPPAQLRRRVDDLGCAAVVVPSAAVATGTDAPFGAVPVVPASTLRMSPALSRQDVYSSSPDELSHLQLTSGTTGEPRAVMLRHRNVVSAVGAGFDVLDPSASDIMVGWLPLHHDLGLVRFVFDPLYFGTPCYLLEPAMTALPTWLYTISEVGGTITAAPDFAYRLVSRLVDPQRVSLQSLRFATNGGEVVRQTSIRTFEERFAVPGVVRPGYGLAEATLGITSARTGDAIVLDGTGAVSCGRPLSNVRLRVADVHGQDLPAGTRGRILVSGEAVSAGYLNDPEATAEIIQAGWLDTGDVGALDRDGQLYVHGRTRAMIKRAGAAIAPREIEELVDELPGVRRSAAIGLHAGPDALTEVVHVVVEIERRVDAHAQTALSADISDTIRRTLGFAPYAVHFVAPGGIPRTTTGKTQYAELKTLVVSGPLA